MQNEEQQAGTQLEKIEPQHSQMQVHRSSETQIRPLSPVEQMAQLKEMGLGVDDMREMLALQKEYEQNEARKAFHAALAEFKRNPPKIVKDMVNEHYGSDYTSIGNMVTKVSEAMGPYGLSARWDFPKSEDSNMIVVTCILSHTLGHEESVTVDGPPDTSGSKNPLQARKSARTYLKLESFEAVTGMASVAGNLDDDGNASGKPQGVTLISEEQALKIHAKITDNELDMEIFKGWLRKFAPYTDGSIDKLSVEHYNRVISKLEESIKAKRKQDNGEA